MSELEIPLCLRWTVDTLHMPDGNDGSSYPPCISSAIRCRGKEWSLFYDCDGLHFFQQGEHILGLKVVSEVSPDPFDVLVQVEGGLTTPIVTELSENGSCTDRNSEIVEEKEIHEWIIWGRRDEDVERWNPMYRRDGRLRFLVIISLGGDADPKVVRSKINQIEDIDESSTDESTSVQTTLLQSTPSCLETLSQDLSRYMDQGSDPDVEFICWGQSTAAHGAVVCARSPVIASKLTSDIVEGLTRVIQIPDIEPDVFRHFLRYIYTGTLPELTLYLAMNLYEAGDQYVVLGLARRCSAYLLEHLSVQDACDVLVVADAHSDGGLAEKVIENMVETRVPLLCDRWSAFCDDHPRLANKVLNSVMKAVLK